MRWGAIGWNSIWAHCSTLQVDISTNLHTDNWLQLASYHATTSSITTQPYTTLYGVDIVSLCVRLSSWVLSQISSWHLASVRSTPNAIGAVDTVHPNASKDAQVLRLLRRLLTSKLQDSQECCQEGYPDLHNLSPRIGRK